MITRIKYIKQEDGNLISKDEFIIDGKKNHIHINLSTLVFSIGSPDNPVSGGQAISLHSAKYKVKKLLKNLGFSFKNEKRKRAKKPKKSVGNNVLPTN